jgi:RNA polymerase sigma-70 factor, ECF subfamily
MDTNRRETLSLAHPNEGRTLKPAAILNANSIERATTQDNEIVTAAQAGSPTAFSELHTIYSRRLYKTIIAITKSHEDAEDALQETFLRAYVGIHTFEGRSSVYSWLTRIAINSALIMLRKRRARPEMLFDPQSSALGKTFYFVIKDSAANPEQIYDMRERRVKLRGAIRNLHPRLRVPIRMQMAKGLSLREIGRALNISEGAVKVRVHRARLRIAAACREA